MRKLSTLPGGRGQAAVEYLMAYGWVIIAVVLAAVFVWQTNTLNVKGNTGATATGFRHINPVLATAVYRAGEDDFSVTFTNTAGVSVNLSAGGISVNENTGCSVNPIELEDGGNVTVACDFTEGETGYRAGSEGDPYVVEVNIIYAVATAGQPTLRTDSGVIRGPMDA